MAASVANVMFANAVYFPNHKIYDGYTPAGMNYKCINHVYYAFATVGMDGVVYVSHAPQVPWLNIRELTWED